MRSAQKPNMSPDLPDHFVWIDALRGLAALAVVILHYHHFYLADFSDRASLPSTPEYPWWDVVGFFYLHGETAVQVFWVISGFVFAHVYFRRATFLRDYTVARFARLYPLHFATLLIVAAMQWVSLTYAGHWQIYENNDLHHFGLQLLMSSNWSAYSRGFSFNGPIWSVSLELVAYGLFFCALPLLRAYGLAVALLLAACMWELGTGLVFGLRVPGFSPSTFICAGYFFTGTCVYLILRQPRKETRIGLFAAALALWSIGIWQDIDRIMLIGMSMTLVSAVALIDMVWTSPPLAGLKRLGDMSYSIYLIHVPLQMLVLITADLAFDGTRAFAASPLTLPIYLIVTLVLADQVYRRFEVPAGRYLRHKLGASPKKR